MVSLDQLVELLWSDVAQPVLAWITSLPHSYWDLLTRKPTLLAAHGIIFGAAAVAVGARLLLFSSILLFVTPDFVEIAGKLGDMPADATKILYIVGILAGALGLVEGALKLVFGKEAGAFAFATVVGTTFAFALPFCARNGRAGQELTKAGRGCALSQQTISHSHGPNWSGLQAYVPGSARSPWGDSPCRVILFDSRYRFNLRSEFQS